MHIAREPSSSLLSSLEEELAPVLARSSWSAPDEEARRLEEGVRAAVSRHGTIAFEVRCLTEGADVVVVAPHARVRLSRQGVTGWWLTERAYSPQRSARSLAQALMAEGASALAAAR